jgi:D-3-phosphoglycerate dehydrogenase
MKILVVDKFPESHLDQLKKLGCDVAYHPSVKAEGLPRLIGGCKILLVRSQQVTAETIKAGDQLAVILRADEGVGITIDVKAASARGVYVASCGGKNSIAVAELVFALLLGLDRRIPDSVAALRAHRWNRKEFSKADGVYGKTLGIVGLGQVGCEVIKRAHAFGLHVMGTDASLNLQKARELNIEYCPDLDTIFRRADIITIHVNLKRDTKKLVSADRIAMMKPNAILINTTCGEVVDQVALSAALEAKRIRAGLDVFDPEPGESTADFADPILDLPNLYGTPHIGASTHQAQEAIAEEAIHIVETFVKTGVVLNCINLATRTPAKWQLIVRHYDRVGVLACVMDQIRRANSNIEEVHNVIFDGAAAACCRIQLDTEPGDELLAAIKDGNPDIISVESLKIGA